MDNYLESLKSKLELFKLAKSNLGLINATEEQIEKAIIDLEHMIIEYERSERKTEC